MKLNFNNAFFLSVIFGALLGLYFLGSTGMGLTVGYPFDPVAFSIFYFMSWGLWFQGGLLFAKPIKQETK